MRVSVLLVLILTIAVFSSDYYICQPSDSNTISLFDGPGSKTRNTTISHGDAVKLVERDGDHVLLLNAKGQCGWAEIGQEMFNKSFIPVTGEGNENFFDAEMETRDWKLDNLNNTNPPQNADLRIVVSLKGLTMHVMCPAEGFDKVYPVGVGVKGSSGKSITPTCAKKGVAAFRTHYNKGNSWFYMPKRWSPAHFGGFPFIRLSIKNSSGAYTYGMHGPITKNKAGQWYLQRGYVSHGCMRMRGADSKELYSLASRYPMASLVIQQDYEYDAQGNKIDCDYPLWQGE